MSISVCAYILLSCFGGGLFSGMAGFGALIIIVPVLVLALGMGTAIPLSVMCGIATQGFNALCYHRHAPRGDLARMLLGSLPGVWLGSSLLLHLPETLLRAALGVSLAVYAIWNLAGKAPRPTGAPPAPWAYVTGFLSGAFGGAFAINGPPAAIYATRTTWTPESVRGFLGVFCGVLFVFIAATMQMRGLIGPEVWLYSLPAMPACLIGNMCGRMIISRMRAEFYAKLVLFILFLMGLSLCWPALRAAVARF